MKTFLTFISLCFLTACGGGGGGGGSSAPAAITYTYNKMSAAGVGTNFDVDSAAWLWSANTVLWATSDGESEGVPLDISVDSDLNTVVKFNTTTMGFDQDSPASMSWEIVDDAFPESAGNILDDYAAWTIVYGTDTDLVSLTEVGFVAQAYGFYVENGDAFLGTEYVSPLTIFKDYGSSANPYNVGGSSDSLLQTEVISSVIGDKTASGDMPSSGSYQYSSRAVSIGHFSYPVSARSILHTMAIESDGIIDVDHTGKTVSGSVTLDYGFLMGSGNGAVFKYSDGSPVSFGTVSFEGTITGNSVSGTASYSYPLEPGGPEVPSADTTEAQFLGSFYGPNGSEFGGVILIQEYDGGPELTSLSVSVVAAR